MDEHLKTSQENKEAIIRLEGELKLVHQKINTIENNHLQHMQKDIDRIGKVIWTVAIMVLGQVLWTITRVLMG
jgi:predicted neutral ceramidase superfamily lipid hydrolase|tara:strand:+ start:61 stop:279 length:219 start_codon:yes stop_codon:yes gene_type:complete